MSIYSGFATRLQEQTYDHSIDALLYILQKRIIRFYSGQPTDEQKFIATVLKLSQQMKRMQKSKYLQPKSSESTGELVKFMQLYQQNIVAGVKVQPPIQHQTVPVQIQQPVEKIEESRISKKKNSFWVERVVKDMVEAKEDKSQVERVEEPAGSLDKRSSASKERQMVEFRRTNYQNNQIRGVRLRNTSRSNLSRDRNHSQTGYHQAEKLRSNSNYIQAKPPLPNADDQRDDGEMKVNRRFQKMSNNPNEVKPGATRSQAEDIIKQYIVKMKKSKRVSRGSRNKIDYSNRNNDF